MTFARLLIAIALSLAISPLVAADLGDTIDQQTCTGTIVELCFTPVANLGLVSIPVDAVVDPELNFGSPLGQAGLVRLEIVPDLVETPLVSVALNSSDLCATYAVLPFACTTVLSLPLAAPTANPSVNVTQTLPLGHAIVGTLTVKLNGQTIAVVPGYVDIVCPAGTESRFLDLDCDGSTESGQVVSTVEALANQTAAVADAMANCPGGSPRAFDADCDGYTNGQEVPSANPNEWSNPFYKYSTPSDNGRGFHQDWDADGWINTSDEGLISNMFQRCSTPNNPNGWSATNPTSSCEDTFPIGGLTLPGA